MKSINEVLSIIMTLPNKITLGQVSVAYSIPSSTLSKIIKSKTIKALGKNKKGDEIYDTKILTEAIYSITIKDKRDQLYKQYSKYLQKLFAKAATASSIQTLYALLEVGGMYSGHWNPTEEIRRFFLDFNILLRQSARQKAKPLRKYRLALLMYCHTVEMNFAHNLLANLLRIINKETYLIDPFLHLRIKKNGRLKPPLSATAKFKHIKELANKVHEGKLNTYIDYFFSDLIRNAFSHSDYCLTDKEIRYRDRGIATKMSLKKLDLLFLHCFAFYEALFHACIFAKAEYAKLPKYNKLPGYEVMELMKKKKQVYGFKMHFSNGSKAMFLREPETVFPLNVAFEQDGSINFNVGDLSTLTNQWKVNGKLYKKFNQSVDE